MLPGAIYTNLDTAIKGRQALASTPNGAAVGPSVVVPPQIAAMELGPETPTNGAEGDYLSKIDGSNAIERIEAVFDAASHMGDSSNGASNKICCERCGCCRIVKNGFICKPSCECCCRCVQPTKCVSSSPQCIAIVFGVVLFVITVIAGGVYASGGK